MSDSGFVRRDETRSLLGVQFCKALNLNSGRITRLELLMDGSNLPVLTITRAIFGNDGELLRRVMEQYQVTPIVELAQVGSPDPTRPD